MIQKTGTVAQIAYLVQDMDKALAQWTGTLGVGPFFLFENLAISDGSYRGQPCKPNMTIALSYSGGLNVALVMALDDAPSIFQEQLRTRGEGFHHWGIFTESFEEDVARLESQGHAAAFVGTVKVGARFAYMDTTADMGAMVEFIELTPPVRKMFSAIAAAAAQWDGSDPIRSVEALEIVE